MPCLIDRVSIFVTGAYSKVSSQTTSRQAHQIPAGAGLVPALTPSPTDGPHHRKARRLHCVSPRASKQFQPPLAPIPRQTVPTPNQGCTRPNNTVCLRSNRCVIVLSAACPRSSVDRASASGAGSTGSNPVGGTIRRSEILSLLFVFHSTPHRNRSFSAGRWIERAGASATSGCL